ncbi:hypothetical protein TNCV_1365161 [Trichonephila clavipes]|nr:hypothetical protein TNCV_1365161 [Trichonephila clavipes]
MAVAQSPKLGEVHLLWHNQRGVHMKSKRGRRQWLNAIRVCMSKVIQIRHGVAVELSNRIQLPVIPLDRSTVESDLGTTGRGELRTFGRSNNALSKKKFKFRPSLHHTV